MEVGNDVCFLDCGLLGHRTKNCLVAQAMKNQIQMAG